LPRHHAIPFCGFASGRKFETEIRTGAEIELVGDIVKLGLPPAMASELGLDGEELESNVLWPV
jgi:hypothetical protein